jgi:hypothetical protein
MLLHTVTRRPLRLRHTLQLTRRQRQARMPMLQAHMPMLTLGKRLHA